MDRTHKVLLTKLESICNDSHRTVCRARGEDLWQLAVLLVLLHRNM